MPDIFLSFSFFFVDTNANVDKTERSRRALPASIRDGSRLCSSARSERTDCDDHPGLRDPRKGWISARLGVPRRVFRIQKSGKKEGAERF